MERKMTVEQQFPPHAPLQVDDKSAISSLHIGAVVGVLTIIVIAQHGNYSITSPQLPEQRHNGNDLLRTDVLQVSAKSDEVGTLGIDAVDVALQQRTACTGETAHMSIREKHDAVAVEALGKIGKIEVVALYGQFLGSYRGTIDEDVPVDEDEYHRHYIAQIDTAVSPTAPQKTQPGTKREDGFWPYDQSHKEHIDVDPRKVGGNEIANRHQRNRIDEHQHSRQPPQQPQPPSSVIAAPPIVLIEIQIGQHDGKQDRNEDTRYHL